LMWSSSNIKSPFFEAFIDSTSRITQNNCWILILQNANRKRYLLQTVPFVKMESTLHHNNFF
jgi:hypothetical protein